MENMWKWAYVVLQVQFGRLETLRTNGAEKVRFPVLEVPPFPDITETKLGIHKFITTLFVVPFPCNFLVRKFDLKNFIWERSDKPFWDLAVYMARLWSWIPFPTLVDSHLFKYRKVIGRIYVPIRTYSEGPARIQRKHVILFSDLDFPYNVVIFYIFPFT